MRLSVSRSIIRFLMMIHARCETSKQIYLNATKGEIMFGDGLEDLFNIVLWFIPFMVGMAIFTLTGSGDAYQKTDNTHRKYTLITLSSLIIFGFFGAVFL